MSGRKPTERGVLVWMCVLIGVNQLGFGAVIPVLPLYAESFGVSQTAIGATIAVYGLARMVSNIPAGQLADWLGRRAALATGGLVSALGNIWCAFATSYEELVIARFAAGAGAGIALTAGVIVLADITTPARRGRAMAIYQGVFLFAVGIGPLPGGFLAERYGLPAPFLVYGAASALAALVGWFGVPETREFRATPELVARDRISLLEQFRLLMSKSGFRLVSTISLINALARTGALFSIVPLIGRERLLLDASQIGFGLAFGSVVGLLLTYPAGALVDRYGRKTIIVPTTVLTGISMLLFGIAPTFSWFIVACLVWGGASAASGAAPAAYAADIAPPGMTATAMGMFRMLSDIGYVLGPIMLGWLADAYGMQAPLWTAAGLLIGVGILFALYAPETYRRGVAS